MCAALRVGIVGAGVGGATLGALVKKRCPNVSVFVWERSKDEELPPGFNLLLSPNHLECLSSGDEEVGNAVREGGVPFKKWTHRTFGGEVSMCTDASTLTVGEYGSIGRWDDVNRTLRSACDVEYGVDVVGHEYCVDNDEIVVELGGNRFERVDLLVVADGRYSKFRELGLQHRTAPGLSNFRLVLPKKRTDFLDTHERMYNFPDCSRLAEGGRFYHLSARGGGHPDFENVCMKGHARIGIMPLRSNSHQDEEQCYALYGNFRIPEDAQIPKEAKTADGLRALYTPADETEIDDLGQFTLDGLVNHADEIYWARMQRSETRYRDDSGRVLFLGDAASGFFPTLGQGAGQAIEDAVVTAGVLAGATENACPSLVGRSDFRVDVASLTNLVETLRRDRREFVADLSDAHATHMAVGGREALSEFDAAWTSAKGQSALRKLWMQYPLFRDGYEAGLSTRQQTNS